MIQAIWLKFPKPQPTGDPFVDVFPDGLPQPTPTQTTVEIHAVFILENAEGPIASQAGCMLDVIAGIAKTGGAVAGRLDASWGEF